MDLSGNTIQRSLKIGQAMVFISGSILRPWQLGPSLTIHPHAQLSIPRTLVCPPLTMHHFFLNSMDVLLLTFNNKEYWFISLSYLELQDLFTCPISFIFQPHTHMAGISQEETPTQKMYIFSSRATFPLVILFL